MKYGLALPFIIVGLACTPPKAVAPSQAVAPMPRNIFVLMPDPDGHVGRVTITNAGGSSTLNQANQGVEVAESKVAPSKPGAMTPEQIQLDFGAALAAEPAGSFICELHFQSGASALDPETIATLDQVVKEIRQRDSRDIIITGHTDTMGDSDFDMRLSRERARNIRDFLVAGGVQPEYMSVAYHGKGNLLIPTGDEVDEPRNRRVEVIVR